LLPVAFACLPLSFTPHPSVSHRPTPAACYNPSMHSDRPWDYLRLRGLAASGIWDYWRLTGGLLPVACAFLAPEFPTPPMRVTSSHASGFVKPETCHTVTRLWLSETGRRAVTRPLPAWLAGSPARRAAGVTFRRSGIQDSRIPWLHPRTWQPTPKKHSN
jgi:hypothetical protein